MCNVRKNHIRIAFFVSNFSPFKQYAIFVAQVGCPASTYSLVNPSDGAKDFARSSPLKNVGAGKNLSQEVSCQNRIGNFVVRFVLVRCRVYLNDKG